MASRSIQPNPSPSCDDAHINPRLLSPSMGDYGMDGRDIDGEHEVFEDGAFIANVSTPVGDRSAAADGSPGNNALAPGGGLCNFRAKCWQHMQRQKVVKDGITHIIAVCNYCKSKLSAASSGGTGHLNRHYKACLTRLGQTQEGGIQTQLNFSADGKGSV